MKPRIPDEAKTAVVVVFAMSVMVWLCGPVMPWAWWFVKMTGIDQEVSKILVIVFHFLGSI